MGPLAAITLNVYKLTPDFSDSSSRELIAAPSRPPFVVESFLAMINFVYRLVVVRAGWVRPHLAGPLSVGPALGPDSLLFLTGNLGIPIYCLIKQVPGHLRGPPQGIIPQVGVALRHGGALVGKELLEGIEVHFSR